MYSYSASHRRLVFLPQVLQRSFAGFVIRITASVFPVH